MSANLGRQRSRTRLLALLRLLSAAIALLRLSAPSSCHVAHAATFADSAAAAAGRPIAVVNARPFHSEVLSGAMAALAPVADRVAVYMDHYVFKGKDGFRQLVWSYPGLLLRTPQRAAGGEGVPHHRLAFFLSPEASLGYTRWFINATRPEVVVHMIHNADDVEAVQQLLNMTGAGSSSGDSSGSSSSGSSGSSSSSDSSSSDSSRAGRGGGVVTKLVALSPHVAAALKQRGFQADWWLAAWPPAAAAAAAAEEERAQDSEGRSGAGGRAGSGTGGGGGGGGDDIHSCPAFRNGSVPAGPWGFACQGRQDARRRSYDTLWRELQEAVAAATSDASSSSSSNSGRQLTAAAPPPPPRLKVLGRSVGPQSGAGVPVSVRPLVSRVTNAPYPVFYRHLSCSLALLPLFAEDSYYTTKFSSTVLASLTTGTPILADERLLAAYSFLQPAEEHVWLQAPGEGLVAAMQRVAAEPAAAAQRRRAGLAALRARLNREARAYLLALLGEGEERGGGA
ncbi:hypothetical protein CHLRE_10g460250v5 [Chlamydomonas reinhardtii]|uniref:Glycosyl transferase CAP10 domain-containing protein n=1 Tax=Chlamydomonas reinhardtii TaxID=3055 RepID=A0A2K3DBU1_CHLRE|nr:uncharacterized protein CHLRE_10g460250v5 [Chlamydomonas reinhardtii]PNW77999.1 hypothetical protein CHLRE_10g460250v5 [Chlamydomonas reinhardtii]